MVSISRNRSNANIPLQRRARLTNDVTDARQRTCGSAVFRTLVGPTNIPYTRHVVVPRFAEAISNVWHDRVSTASPVPDTLNDVGSFRSQRQEQTYRSSFLSYQPSAAWKFFSGYVYAATQARDT